MTFTYTPFVLALIISSAIMAGLAVYVWRGPGRPVNLPRFGSVLALAAVWAFGFAMEFAANDLSSKIFFSNLQFTMIALLPVVILAVAMQFTGRIRLYRLGLILAGGFALTTILLTWTGRLHHLFRYDYRVVQEQGLTPLVGTDGPWYFVFSVVSNLVMLTTFVLLLEYAWRAPTLFRRQALMMIACLLPPEIVNALYLLGVTPVTNLNFTPMTFLISGIIFLLGVVEVQMLEVVPVARATILDKMQDSILVMDAANRVVDINPAGCKMLGIKSDAVIGKTIQEVLARWPELYDLYGSVQQTSGEITVREEYATYYYELQIYPITSGSRMSGRLAIIRNITDRKRTEEELRYLGTHDALTGLYNRAFFEAEMSRLEKSRLYPISIVMIDLNGIKQTNDRFGHDAGDELFRLTARIFRSIFRAEDVIARIGGDEFAILLPQMDEDAARNVIKRLRKALAEQPAAGPARLSMSIGCATALGPAELRATLKEADDRMYEDKGVLRSLKR